MSICSLISWYRADCFAAPARSITPIQHAELPLIRNFSLTSSVSASIVVGHDGTHLPRQLKHLRTVIFFL